ncbi:hypothetical protein H1R20_g12331, partial [Candolleomyces eurysporus]
MQRSMTDGKREISPIQMDDRREILATYLIQEKDFGIIDFIMEPFDVPVPKSVASYGQAATKILEATLTAVMDLTTVILTLELCKTKPELLPFKYTAVIHSISEKWSVLLRWCQVLVFQFPVHSQRPRLSQSCLYLLRMILNEYNDDYTDELFSLPCTIDFIYLLLLRAADSGTPADGDTATILEMISSSLPKTTREAVISIIVRQSAEVVGGSLAETNALHYLEPKTKLTPTIFTVRMGHLVYLEYLLNEGKNLLELKDDQVLTLDVVSCHPGVEQAVRSIDQCKNLVSRASHFHLNILDARVEGFLEAYGRHLANCDSSVRLVLIAFHEHSTHASTVLAIVKGWDVARGSKRYRVVDSVFGRCFKVTPNSLTHDT